MRIILFSSSTNKSGGARQALYLAQGLADRGHEVSFFLPESSTLPEIAPNFPSFCLLGKKSSWKKSIEAAFPSDGSPCVVHAFHNAAVKKVALWGLFWRKKAVVVAHRGVLFRPKNPLPYWSWGIDHFAVNSQTCAEVLHGLGLSWKRLSVVPNMVPDSRLVSLSDRDTTRETIGVGPEEFLFGIVANNNPNKGVRQAIEAFASRVSHKFSHAKLLIVGIRPELWSPLCEELGVKDKVILQSPSEDVASFYQAMDAFVLPSLSESMPNTLLEAVCSHLPCIGTKVGAVPYILDACGLCVEPDDISSLGGGMLRFLKDPNFVQGLKKQTFIESHKYSPRVRLDSMESIYTEQLKKRGFIQ